MTSERSYEQMTPGQQLYRVIEFCNSAEALYAKIESGQYDWLGVRPSKGGRVTYVLGRPPIGRSEGIASGVGVHGAAATSRNRVEIRIPHRLRPGPSGSWWETPEEARAEFERQKLALKEGAGSGLYRLTLYVDDELVDEDFVVRVLPNFL